MNKDSVIGFSIGLLSGAVIGGVIALLFAPKTGKETRQLIKDKTTEVVSAVKDKASEVVDAVKCKSTQAMDEFKDKTRNITGDLRY